MNVWTDIALGNLTRHRGPPMDMDIETGELIEPESFRCAGPCGERKLSTDFYMKHDKRTGKHHRQSTCRVCVNARDKDRKPDTPFKITARSMIVVCLERPMTLREICEEIGFTRRPTDQAIKKLIADGIVKHAGFTKLGTNSRIPMYEKTTTPAAPAERT